MDATNLGKDTSFTVHELTMAHCDFVYWRGFWEVIRRSSGSDFYKQLEALAQVVRLIFSPSTTYRIIYIYKYLTIRQFSLSILQTAHKEIYAPYSLNEQQRRSLSSAYDEAIDNLSRLSQSIISAYGFTDFEMDSALARPDMDPYEALLHGAKSSEMNNLRELWPAVVDARKIWGRLEEEKAKL